MFKYNDISKESLAELQLKFKLLYVTDTTEFSNNYRKSHIKRLSLKVVHYLNLKKITSGKVHNRIVRNYFKQFLLLLYEDYIELVETNKTNLDRSYAITTAIQSLYDFGRG
uniref:Uncharacterized protein n=1 Tax=Cryptomonas sp. SAG 977-2f TaxID=279061 RepID=A0A679CAQ0_9CRYP|nr:hypothetical protein CrySAG9772f_p079 [Cryptomonas sp. SAG 977-2f]